jgi:hypothetical protein
MGKGVIKGVSAHFQGLLEVLDGCIGRAKRGKGKQQDDDVHIRYTKYIYIQARKYGTNSLPTVATKSPKRERITKPGRARTAKETRFKPTIGHTRTGLCRICRTDFPYSNKPVPMAHGYMGLFRFHTPLESERDCQRSTRNCAFPATTTTNYHKNMSREGKWVVHPPISSKGMLSINTISSIYARGCQNQNSGSRVG